MACSCVAAPGLEIERRRLQDVIGAQWLGTCGDQNHTYGYHVAACNLPGSDYSMQGAANRPVDARYGCAIDIGMGWPASRSWLRWLIREIREDRITGIAEVIGSYDGRDVRYWSDSSGWDEYGENYEGDGHDTWTHVAIYRSTANDDHRLLAGWNANGQDSGPTPQPGEDDDDMGAWTGPFVIPKLSEGGYWTGPINPVRAGSANPRDAWVNIGADTFGKEFHLRLWRSDGAGNWTPFPQSVVAGDETPEALAGGIFRFTNGLVRSFYLPAGTWLASASRAKNPDGTTYDGYLAFGIEHGDVIR